MMNDSSIIDLVYLAKENRIDVFLNEGQLQVKLPKDRNFDKSLLEKIKENKEAILSFLKKNERVGQTNKIPIIARQFDDLIPLSFNQEGMWFTDQLEDSSRYHIPFLLQLRGTLNKEGLNVAFKSIISRHEVLRTVILSEDGAGYQQIKDKDEWQLSVEDASVYHNDPAGLEQKIESLIKRPFDLSKDYMLRASLLVLDDQKYVLVSTMHHIASDGWSTSVLVKELIEFYAASIENRPARLETLPVQYADYALWQRNHLKGDVLEKKLSYWKEKLGGAAALELPTDFARPAVQSTRGAVTTFTIEKELSVQLQELSRQQGTTMFMTLLAAFKVLLHRYSVQQDICVGTGIAGRQYKELEGLIGFFVNLLALRSQVSGSTSFTDLLNEVKATTMEAYEHQDLPFEKVVDAVSEERNTGRSPLFQVLFVMQNTPEVPHLQLGDVQLSNQPFEQGISKFDLTYFINETPGGLRGSIEYCTDLYKEESILRMLGHYKQLLASIVAQPAANIAALAMLSVAEQAQLTESFNNTQATCSTEKSITELIEEQAAKTSGNIALIFEDQQLTYGQLNERSNQLAHYLQSKGVQAGTLVPILSERSAAMIIAILGILKAGGAYVPVDPEYPAERISYLLKDTAATIVVTTSESSSKLPDAGDIEVIATDDEWIAMQPKTNLQSIAKPSALAYVIYTSGSTGQPKGVMIEHGSLLNYLLTSKDKYLSNKEKSSGTFLHLSYTFDASVTGIFLPLLAGKSIVIGSRQSVEVFEDSNLWQYAPYDFIKLTPSHLPLLESVIEAGEELTRRLIVGGEALRQNHFAYLAEKGIDIEIINEYGPTEATVGCSTYSFHTISDAEKIKESNSISIGKPMDNVQLYILDNEDGLVPVGVSGEICIGGAGVARGYLNREELTSQKFISNPFSKTTESARLYKTGDLGKWTAAGNIEYIGRKDDQVKIRGYRIEPGEIEACLAAFEGIKDAKVLVSENETTSSKSLNAYLQVDKERLPLLSNYLNLQNKKQVQSSDLNTLPNGLPILNSNLNEVKFLYHEIFEDHCYLKHGITLNPDSVVVDIGANAGFFTVFLNILSEDIKVYSVEPIPEVYHYLSANRQLYNIKGKAFQLAILDTEKEVDFTYYPGVSIVSGVSEEQSEVKDVVTSYIRNSDGQDLLAEEIESLLEVKLESKQIKVQTKTLSQIIEEEKIEKIDLLKIDVENSEHLVIDGIAAKDWDKIRSIIIEVHDTDGRLENIKTILTQKGFTTYVEKEQMLSKDDILYNLFALRDQTPGAISTLGQTEELRTKQWLHPQELVKTIREDIEEKLPSYMLPANIILLDQFPMTRNGKIDKKALPKAEAGEQLPEGDANAVAETETEKTLTEIWKDLLGLETVGLHDNFFNLGGDSIITIQMVSRARAVGYTLAVADVFAHQTIAGLTKYLEHSAKSSAEIMGEQGLLTGSAGLLPIQQWYFENKPEPSEISHFNQSVLMGINKDVTIELLQSAVDQITAHHDALRFAYQKHDENWQQDYGVYKGKVTEEDLQSARPEEWANLVSKLATIHQRSLNIEKGELMRAVLMKTPQSETYNRLFIVIHHLAIDGVSWRIVLEDLERLLTGLSSGKKVDLGSKSTSYRQWYKALEKYGQTTVLLDQKDYWNRVVNSYEPLLVDKVVEERVRIKDTSSHTMRLGVEKTRQLLHDVPRVFHTEINDILLCALARTLCEWSETDKIVIGLEGHGREHLADGIDTSHTVGWFTTLFPVLLSGERSKKAADLIKTVKEQLRRVPAKGLGYGVLRYINKDNNLAGKEPWDIVFNYMGQIDNAVRANNWLSIASESTGQGMSDEHVVSDKLSINSSIRSEELVLAFTYSKKNYHEETISRLAAAYISNLEWLIAEALEQGKSTEVFTPSDYGLGAVVGYEELDAFLEEDNIDNIMSF
jgi:amino acid adenylation domain-containing protein/non-ribosomal peptide synthase protein (TIGR01720 family)/FkbM family methyltransferase